MTEFGGRRERLIASLSGAGFEAALVTSPANVRYLTGFTGSAGGLWLPVDGSSALLADSRYEEQAGLEVGDEVRVEIGERGWQSALPSVADGTPGPVAFNPDRVTVSQHEQLREVLPAIAWEPKCRLVEELREVKSVVEQDAISRAVHVAEEALEAMLRTIDWASAPTERKVATALVAELGNRGSGPLPFDPIVAGGERSALPHAKPSGRRLASGDLLLIDWGARVDGYCSDLTRTFVLGSPVGWQVRVHMAVHSAQREGRRVIAHEVPARSVDSAARDVLEHHGFREYFGHSTGHGFGLEVHEAPSLSTRDDGLLKPGNVVTVEPGVYLPGLGGVRIEDDVIVTEEGGRTLSSLPRELGVLA